MHEPHSDSADGSNASRERGRGLRSDGDAQSEVLGLVLLLGVAIVGIGVALALGFSAFDATKDRTDVSQAEHAFSQLDSEASAVALGDADVRDVELGLLENQGEVRTDPDAGWMRVRILNKSTGNPDWSTGKMTLGAVVYEHGDATVAYQGGGIWRADRHGSTMVSPPEMHYRNGTLTIPVVAVRGQGGVHSHVQMTPGGPTERKFPDPEAGYTNRLQEGKVTVTVHSEYYEAWGEHFEESTNAYVWYDHDAQEVTAVFLALPRWGTLDDGIIATSGAGQLRLVADGSYIDSYNSSEDPYESSQSKNGIIRAVGDILTKANSTILGDVYSGKDVMVEQTSLVDGDVYYTENFTNTATVTGNNTTIDGVPAVTPIDGFVDASVRRIKDDNDNDATSVIDSNDELDIDGSRAELGSGSYYLENFHLAGEKLVLDTTDGDITIAVRDWMKLAKDGNSGSNLTVEGNGTVRVFIKSEEKTPVQVTGGGNVINDAHLGVEKNSDVYISGQRSPQLRFYAPRDFHVAVSGSESSKSKVSFVGVIYAPGGKDGSGIVYIKHADLYGQILTGNLTLGKNGAVHYDRALKGTPLPQSPTVARIEFMHVAVHEVNVTSADVRAAGMESPAFRPGPRATLATTYSGRQAGATENIGVVTKAIGDEGNPCPVGGRSSTPGATVGPRETTASSASTPRPASSSSS